MTQPNAGTRKYSVPAISVHTSSPRICKMTEAVERGRERRQERKRRGQRKIIIRECQLQLSPTYAYTRLTNTVRVTHLHADRGQEAKTNEHSRLGRQAKLRGSLYSAPVNCCGLILLFFPHPLPGEHRNSSFYMIILIFIYFLKRLFYFLERRREVEREGEKHQGVVASRAHYWGPGQQPKHVPWLGIEPAPFWFSGCHSIHWATPARAHFCF